MGVKNKIFGMHLTCMNWRRKAEKQRPMKLLSGMGAMDSDSRRCFQNCLKRRITDLTQLSSMEGMLFMTDEKLPSDS